MTVVDEYICLAEDWGAAMEDGDSKTANLMHDRIQDVFQELCRMEHESALFDRADKVSDAACFFIASHLKDIDEPRAIGLYNRLILSARPFVALSAKYILKEIGTPE